CSTRPGPCRSTCCGRCRRSAATRSDSWPAPSTGTGPWWPSRCRRPRCCWSTPRPAPAGCSSRAPAPGRSRRCSTPPSPWSPAAACSPPTAARGATCAAPSSPPSGTAPSTSSPTRRSPPPSGCAPGGPTPGPWRSTSTPPPCARPWRWWGAPCSAGTSATTASAWSPRCWPG
ncbi:MAG: hypothetical protein AVDCRST_MAG35-738, partial [uncultured Quadrisphaera sp.]